MSKKQFYDYQGEKILVRYEPQRCIHAEECIKGAPEVFVRDRRPWIAPDEGDVDQIARVVRECPTGALQFERRDGGEGEPTPTENRARPATDGPLYLEGRLTVSLPDGQRREETRLALCRCGASQNKPYCDNSHVDSGFRDGGELGVATMAPMTDERGGVLELTLAKDGPVLFRGPLAIQTASEPSAKQTGARGALCRCGASQNRPYCDGSHVAAGFEADSSSDR